MKLGKRIKEFRKSKGITAKFVAEKAGMTPAALSEIEREKCNPTITQLIALADFYNITLDNLVGRDIDSRKSA